jgi:hypothetical protein
MMTKRMRAMLLAGLLPAAAVWIVGCTNSEELSSGVDTVAIDVELVNTDTRFGVAFFDLQQISVTPIDPDAAEAAGPSGVGLLNSASSVIRDIDLNEESGMFETGAPLTVGAYLLDSISFQNLDFRDATRLGSATCQEYITNYPSVAGPVTINNFGREVIVNVVPGKGVVVKMQIDSAALVQAYQDAWTCKSGFPTCGFPVAEPWCIAPFSDNQFDAFEFADLAPNYIQID